MAAQFPTRPNPSFPTEPAGPPHVKLRDLPLEYPVTVKTMKDGGATYGMPNPYAIRRWELTYQGLTAAEAATLVSHFDDAQGPYEGFDFRHPRTDVLYTDCHYDSFERDHEKVWINSFTIVIVKRPA